VTASQAVALRLISAAQRSSLFPSLQWLRDATIYGESSTTHTASNQNKVLSRRSPLNTVYRMLPTIQRFLCDNPAIATISLYCRGGAQL
jgi:hypothetical protein